LPHEATRARTAFIATHLLEQAEGSISCPQEDTRARLAPTKIVSREQSEGHTPPPYEDTQASLASIATSSPLKSEGPTLNPYEDTRASSARKTIATHYMLKQSRPPPLFIRPRMSTTVKTYTLQPQLDIPAQSRIRFPLWLKCLYNIAQMELTTIDPLGAF
jgi:hypothetical protein